MNIILYVIFYFYQLIHGDLHWENILVSNVKEKGYWNYTVNGINYYIDDNNYIYDPQDVYQNKINPRKIHKYVKNDKGEFIITDI